MARVKSVWNLGGATIIASLVSIAASTIPPSAAVALFVKVGPTNAPGPNRCLGFAADAARDERLQNIQNKNGLVSGVRDDKSVVMVCVGTVVVISVAGDRQPEVGQLAEDIFKHISNISGQ